MRRLFALILVVLMMFCSAASAEAIDLTAMSQDELIALIEDARLELSKYMPFAEKGTVLYEDENIKITLNGELEILYGGLVMPVVIENYTDRNLLVSFNNSSCNGWDIMEGATSVNANKKAKADVTFLSAVEDADLTSVDDVEDITASIRYTDSDDFMWSRESETTVTWMF